MNAHAADTRPVMSFGDRVPLNAGVFTTHPERLARHIGAIVTDLIEHAVTNHHGDPTTLHVEAHRDGGTDLFVVRVTARQKESQ